MTCNEIILKNVLERKINFFFPNPDDGHKVIGTTIHVLLVSIKLSTMNMSGGGYI